MAWFSIAAKKKPSARGQEPIKIISIRGWRSGWRGFRSLKWLQPGCRLRPIAEHWTTLPYKSPGNDQSYKNAAWSPCNRQIRREITSPDGCSRGRSTKEQVLRLQVCTDENVTSLYADWGVNTFRTSPLGFGSYSKHGVCLRPFCSADEGRGVLIKIVPSSPGECSPSEPIETILLVRSGGTFSSKSGIIIINWDWRPHQSCCNHSLKVFLTTTDCPWSHLIFNCFINLQLSCFWLFF